MWHYFKNSFPLNILLILLAIMVGYSSSGMLRRAYELYKEKWAGEEKIKEFSQKKAELEARITEFTTPEAREREAKSRLNLKRQGEEVVVVVPKDGNGGVASTADSIWKRLGNFFGLR